MSNDDWRRNDQERYRDQDNDRRRSHQGQSYGRGTDDQGDGTIAQRGFGNAQSGYDRGGDDRDRGYSRLGGGDYDRGGFGRGSRESMDNRSYRGDDRSQSGTFSGNDYSSGFYGADQGRGTSRNPDRDAAHRPHRCRFVAHVSVGAASCSFIPPSTLVSPAAKPRRETENHRRGGHVPHLVPRRRSF